MLLFRCLGSGGCFKKIDVSCSHKQCSSFASRTEVVFSFEILAPRHDCVFLFLSQSKTKLCKLISKARCCGKVVKVF